jgi:hypothetical protein
MADLRQIVVFIYASWLGDLKPAFGEEKSTFEKGLEKYKHGNQYSQEGEESF